MLIHENKYQKVYAKLNDSLDPDDDINFWKTLIISILDEIDDRWNYEDLTIKSINLGIFKVSSWKRPHQTRWTASGGFAWPSSYSLHADEHSLWNFWIGRDEGLIEWDLREKPRRRKRNVFNAYLAAPGNTSRHNQGAAMMEWRPKCPYKIAKHKGLIREMYGLRKSNSGIWKIVAHQEYGENKST